MSQSGPALLAGNPHPLGATWDGLGVNFAVFSAHATQIELCLFDPSGRHEVERFYLPEYTDEVFHGYLPGARPGLLYGFRAHGPYEPERGHRFNPHKLLIDPYAKALAGRLRWSDSLFGYRVGSGRGDLSFDRRDSAAAMPKAVVVGEGWPWGREDERPRHPWPETLIYEAHVRGLTMRRADLPPEHRGTFSGLADPEIVDHLLRLGVTTIELMPIEAFLQDHFLLERGLVNYWGYSPLGFFAPERRYAEDAAHAADELRGVIRRLHAAGLEVVLDVVYNHTCEGNQCGPTLSWRGLDNASYYRLVPGNERYFVDNTGTGNTLNVAHPRVLQMVLDSLRYWANEYRIDGFRFDLCATLGREGSAFDPNAAFFKALRQDPALSGLKLIAEPWDLGPGGYQLGNHPPGFAEWNDKFRNTVRRYWRGDAGQRAELPRRLMGSSELFERHWRRPWASVNHVTTHDGMTLHDLTTYAERQNEANREEGCDGQPDNLSANWGVEGETDDRAINEIRERVRRAMLATLFFSYGTPMLRGGDEIGRTQRGNNNVYCQDNELSWFDWSGMLGKGESAAKALYRFTMRLNQLRRRHPSLASPFYIHGSAELLPGIMDVEWFDERGRTLSCEAWQNGAAQLLAVRRVAVQGKSNADVTLIMLNPTERDRDFVAPEPRLPFRIALDTARPDGPESAAAPEQISVAAHSLVLLVAELAREAHA